jgi:2-polyprenyl-3-methyl-5-hydroxy-6-metoxy-1,4-benzoquinol methylase
MERKYWEKIAPEYNEEIFDVLKNDRKALIRSAIEQAASASATVLDLGCAIGKWLPVLSPLFRKVLAVDISAKNLAIAKDTYPELGNVEFIRADMSGKINLPKADVVVCINAILTESLKKRTAFFRQLSYCLKKGGKLILVVPSLESWLLTRVVQHRWQIDRKLFHDKISSAEGARRYKNIKQGNVEIDQVATKHYLQEELYILLQQEGFKEMDAQKVEYKWDTEFVNPPAWLKKPGPWDWLITAVRKA